MLDFHSYSQCVALSKSSGNAPEQDLNQAHIRECHTHLTPNKTINQKRRPPIYTHVRKANNTVVALYDATYMATSLCSSPVCFQHFERMYIDQHAYMNELKVFFFR
jgi:hypothetical protein